MTLSVRRSTGGSGDVGPIKADILMKILMLVLNKAIFLKKALLKTSINKDILQEIEGLTSNMDGM